MPLPPPPSLARQMTYLPSLFPSPLPSTTVPAFPFVFSALLQPLAPLSRARRRCAVTVRAAAAKPRMQGPSKWAGQWSFLKQNNLKSVDPMAASKEMSSGRYVLVDVRPKAAYEKAHAEGSVNVPLYQ
eukprot:83058-Chlamydomonas_euryale.AAC.1